MTTPLIDIGANLAHDSFDPDRADALARAGAAGVAAIVVTGSSAASSRKALALAQAPVPAGAPRLYATAGLHPHHASAWDAEHAALLRDLAGDPRCVALGECGLDYFRNYSSHEDQRRAFVAQLELAAGLGKPVFLHQREAHAEFLPILREFRPQLAGAVVHCFTDTAQARDDYLALGCSIGITGWICDERRGLPLRDVAKGIPADRLMVETDAPYLLPRTAPKTPHRRNEPAFLRYVVEALAQSRDETPAAVAEATVRNARRFFRLSAS